MTAATSKAAPTPNAAPAPLERRHVDTPFHDFQAALAARFAELAAAPGARLFRAAVLGDDLWAAYLAAFPPGSNLLYRERTEHDCSCCRHFVRTAGAAVFVADDLAPRSIWSGLALPPDSRYAPVAAALARRVESAPLEGALLHYERQVGTAKSFEEVLTPGGAALGDTKVIAWEHFHLTLPTACVAPKADIPTRLGEARSTRDVFARALEEWALDALDTVLDLAAQGSLYRGEEFRGAVAAFREEKARYDAEDNALSGEPGSPAHAAYREHALNAFAWHRSAALPLAVSRLRGTAIGTLVTDLSEGKDTEDAVRAYEAKVAPQNYRRPTALVTPRMVEAAKAKVAELGLAPALERRHAVVEDVALPNVLWASRPARGAMRGAGADAVFDGLAAGSARVDPRKFDRVEEIAFDDFAAQVLPRASALDVLFEGRHAGNLVTLVAPTDPTAPLLFKWPNGFSWSYAGEAADGIKQRVKAAGGDVTGDLRCSLSWSNYDDLDLHMREPATARLGHGHTPEIYFANKVSAFTGGGLDVDMNAGGGTTRTPVENISYPDRRRMLPGDYVLYVNNYCKRESKDIGFEVEVEFDGEVRTFAYEKAVRDRENVEVAVIRVDAARNLSIVRSLPATTRVRTLWGLQTQQWCTVNLVALSPNHWDGRSIGNRHFMFFLEGCRAEGAVRGFYNEFLKDELAPHRKVMEMVGARTTVPPSDRQLSGLGFSSTRRDTLLVKVHGVTERALRVRF